MQNGNNRRINTEHLSESEILRREQIETGRRMLTLNKPQKPKHNFKTESQKPKKVQKVGHDLEIERLIKESVDVSILMTNGSEKTFVKILDSDKYSIKVRFRNGFEPWIFKSAIAWVGAQNV
jgi:hypothetical protein